MIIRLFASTQEPMKCDPVQEQHNLATHHGSPQTTSRTRSDIIPKPAYHQSPPSRANHGDSSALLFASQQAETIPAQARLFNANRYIEKTNKIRHDAFGNQYVDVSPEHGSFKRYLLSSQPLHYPTPEEVHLGQVEGCMSFNYYITLNSAVSVLIQEAGKVRQYHSFCDYLPAQHRYVLVNIAQPHPPLAKSISSLANSLSSQLAPKGNHTIRSLP